MTTTVKVAPCGCAPGQARCEDANGMWEAANAIYRGQGYDAWQKALEPYNEHNARVDAWLAATGAIEARGVELKWHQTYVPPFDDAEYYEGGAVVTVTCDGFGITVDRDGESELVDHVAGRTYKTPAEFREAFPDGSTPVDNEGEHTWENNGWFDHYRASDGSHIEEWDGVAHSLLEALDDAAGNVIRIANDARTIRDANDDDPDVWIQDV